MGLRTNDLKLPKGITVTALKSGKKTDFSVKGIPVCLPNSSFISSLVLFFGMFPTNNLKLAMEILTFKVLPFLISKPSS